MVRAAPSPVALPKVQFEKVEDEVSSGGPPGVQDGQARAFGYNDGYPYVRPELYIRHIEPLEIDLARQVEYDMDEQDEEWLEAVNVERKKEQMDKVSAETFEIIMDRLEKEWFDLTKNLPKSDLAMPSEDSTCAVCDDSEGENSNAIVFCDGCNLAVHQDCYGVPYIPEGQWLCRKCTVSPENPVQCYLCPNEGGAFKQTIHGEWVHLLCAIWVPETRVANDVFMEPITGIEKISKQRWKLRCSICDVREGACIQCAKSSCFVAFHATCARHEKLLLPMKTTQGAEPTTLQAYCERHLPREQQEIRAAALAAAESEQAENKHSSKAARAYNKTYKPGPPIVPAIIVNRIVHYINRIRIRKRPEFVQQVCRYWSLKREARRGAPLLKRLHLEPWTASGGKIQTVEQKRMKLEQLKSLRSDLTHVKMLTLLIKFRELRKLRQTEIVHQILTMALYRHESALRMALETIMGADKQDFFKNPVNKNDVPDYFDVITNPMCWAMVEDRLDKHEYWDVKTFRDDIDLVINNAILYNSPGTPFYKAALRIRSVSQPILKNLERLALPSHGLPQPAPAGSTEASSSSESLPPVGDLESPLNVLELIKSSGAMQDAINIDMKDDPITSLINTEPAVYKPPPPPSPIVPAPPPPPTTKSKKSSHKKRDRKAEAERSKARKEAQAMARASMSQTPGVVMNDEEMMKVEALDSEGRVLEFREPRATRATLAAAAAFEKEAHGGAIPDGAEQVHAMNTDVGGAGEAGPSRQRKRPSVSVPPPTIPRVVDDVDEKQAFSLFHSGWILGSDARRGGRAPVEKAALLPPKKRQRTGDHTDSRRPSGATSVAPSDFASSPVEETRPDAAGEASSARMDVDPFSVPPNASFEGDVVQRTKVDPTTGRVVIEELDTPATRRQKSAKKKAERKKSSGPGAVVPGQGQEQGQGEMKVDEDGHERSGAPGATEFMAAPSSPVPAVETPGAGPSKPKRPTFTFRKVSIEEPGTEAGTATATEDVDSESELSELSDLPSEESPQKGGEKVKGETNEKEVVQQQAAPARKKPVEARKRKGKKAAENYESGTLVWAKAESYPWWPAVVFDADHPDIPPRVLSGFKETRTRRKMKLYIVRFYDHNNSWQYLAREKLQLLGEDESLDADMIAPSSINQKWKSGNARTSCRAAYRKALNEMETKSDGGTDLAALLLDDEGEEKEKTKGKEK